MTHRLLVVDDQDAARFVKVQILRRAGYDVVEAATGLEGLALVDREKPDLIVLDVNLPDISGLEVSRRLRDRHKELPALQILQVSNTAVAPADRVRGLEQGADVYLVEPVEADVLLATVHALLRVHRAEKALAEALVSERRARAVAEEASRLKDDFLATLSHELRTPLNALMGWIWQLRHSHLNEEARARALESLERNGRIQAQLINDLLDVSRISKGKLQLEMRLLDFKRIVEGAYEATHDALEHKGLHGRLDAEAVYVAGDEGRLQQIVTNLLTNAVQFTPPGGSISVSLKAEQDEAVLVISDTGTGIHPSFLPHVFDQFRQGEAGLSRKHGGLGLGLAVVRQLVELHSGTVAADSRGPGAGAAFTVRLPREAAALATGPADGRTDLLLKGVKVAIGVADRIDREALKATLESSGASVPLAAAAIDAPSSPAEIDVVAVYSPQEKQLRLRRAADPAAGASTQTVARASDVVRQIARFVAEPAPLRS